MRQSHAIPFTSDGMTTFGQTDGPVARTMLPASPVRRLVAALDANGISYCQWKGHRDPGRWARGEGDLDLLVARVDAFRLARALEDAGFREASPSHRKNAPGTFHCYAYDADAPRFIHVHVHYQLWLGSGVTSYHVPLETAILQSSGPGAIMRTPSPEAEWIVFVLRMVLERPAWHPLRRQRGLSPRREAERRYLMTRVRPEKVAELLRTHLPAVSPSCFERCEQSLLADCVSRIRSGVTRELRRRLHAHVVRPSAADWVGRLVARWRASIPAPAGLSQGRNILVTGGTMIAVLGGDGAGKTTAVGELCGWLSPTFDTRSVHLGKPPRSVATLLVAAIRRSIAVPGRVMGLDQPGRPNVLLLLRSVCIARDRYRLYCRARRGASRGQLVICDRYPTRLITSMDGPNIRVGRSAGIMGRIVRGLQRAERAYYDRILPPDLLVVLRLHPDLAAARKTDEDTHYVRTRTREVWDLDFQHTAARVIDASRPKPEVLAELRALVWSSL